MLFSALNKHQFSNGSLSSSVSLGSVNKLSDSGWSNREIKMINKYKQNLKHIENENLEKKILNKDTNSIDFYKITPKQELPKFLQKMKFQTLHCKENIGKSVVKIFGKKDTNSTQEQSREQISTCRKRQQKSIRKKLKQQGNILFLSDIYQDLSSNNHIIVDNQTQFQKQSSGLRRVSTCQKYKPVSNVDNLSDSCHLVAHFGNDLQEWEKNRNATLNNNIMFMRKRLAGGRANSGSLRHRQSRIIQEKLSQLERRRCEGMSVSYFKEGANYRKEIEKQLDIINKTHSQETSQVSKCQLIESSSRLLKKELDERKAQVEQSIRSKLRILNETRIEHHNLYEIKSRYLQEQRQFADDYGFSNGNICSSSSVKIVNSSANINLATCSMTSSFGNNSNKGIGSQNGPHSPLLPHSPLRQVPVSEIRAQKKHQIEQNELKIIKNKKLIESLQSNIQTSEEELRSIVLGELAYFRASLKYGEDCRETGLGWILKHLRILGGETGSSSQAQSSTCDHQSPEYEFPSYLDRKSKEFLVNRTQSQDQLEQLLEQKRRFVNEIGQHSGNSTSHSNSKAPTMISASTLRYSSSNLRSDSKQNSSLLVAVPSRQGLVGSANSTKVYNDSIIEEQSQTDNAIEIPKKYRRSLRKITILNQEFQQNQSLLELKDRKEGQNTLADISSNTDGLTGKQLYNTIGQRIKLFDFSRVKKEKGGSGSSTNSKLLQYQSLLNSIKDIHIHIEELDIQHENHLVSHYKDSKTKFFQQAAACFGYKKSYSLIIKHFSWKNDSTNKSINTTPPLSGKD